MKYSKQEVAEAKKFLLGKLETGDTVYTVLRHVSRSGMSRDISIIWIGPKGEKYNLDWAVSRVLEYPLSKNEGIKVGGAGMDMGFHLIYSLGRALFEGEWECTGDNCPFNEHFNDSKKYPREKGLKHKGDGGYTLIHAWI